MQKFLIIQTAFTGDVVLASSLIEKLHHFFPESQIDFLLRKGNESLFKDHPWLHSIIVWDKKKNKTRNLLKLLGRIRKEQYDKVINLQRFASTGWLTAFSGAKQTIGFDKNPFSRLFTLRVKHILSSGANLVHESERNLGLIAGFTDGSFMRPALYPSRQDFDLVHPLKKGKYLVIAPASIWFTKQFPKDQWIKFVNLLPNNYLLYLLGAPNDNALCEEIRNQCVHKSVTNLCGKLSFLQSAALMKDADMNYVNDSAPLHFASAMNAPVTVVYCSTIPAFGFGPLSDKRYIVEIEKPLDCRPCGLHGYKACPRGHFNCARQIRTEQLLATCPE
jgi:ADP-heptose:LPS heptosyltransferase